MSVWLLLFCLLLSSSLSAQQFPHPLEIPLEARPHSGWDFEVIPWPLPPPPHTHVMVRQGLPCRIAPDRLPWLVASADPGRSHLLRRAVAVWTEASLSLGLGTLLQVSDDPLKCDVVVRWSDPRLPPDKAGATWWQQGARFQRVLGISMDGSFAIPDGNRVQILSHELGHVLGLSESYQPGNLMYYIMDRRRLQPGNVRLSHSDRLSLHWLYQQRRFLPIVGRRN